MIWLAHQRFYLILNICLFVVVFLVFLCNSQQQVFKCDSVMLSPNNGKFGIVFS